MICCSVSSGMKPCCVSSGFKGHVGGFQNPGVGLQVFPSFPFPPFTQSIFHGNHCTLTSWKRLLCRLLRCIGLYWQIKCWEQPCNGFVPFKGEEEIPQGASCYRNWDKLRLYGPLAWVFFFHIHHCSFVITFSEGCSLYWSNQTADLPIMLSTLFPGQSGNLLM